MGRKKTPMEGVLVAGEATELSGYRAEFTDDSALPVRIHTNKNTNRKRDAKTLNGSGAW